MPDALGVIGGGQLGRYFVLAARARGVPTVVLEPDPLSPAGAVADLHLIANYDDEAALKRMAHECSAVTVEFENPPVATLEFLSQHLIVRPSPTAVAVAQDRQREKQLCRDLGLATAPWEFIETASDVDRIVANGIDDSGVSTTGHYIVKTARLGYDGKGQVRITDLRDLGRAWSELNHVTSVVEAAVPLDAELSIILARAASGEIATYAPTLNVHVDGILDTSVAPFDAVLQRNSSWSIGISDVAVRAATTLAEHLSYVGVLAVEFFVSHGRLLVNELAPRPHNSGHWTLDAARTSQFDQQVRALAGLPLGDTSMTCDAVAMGNLLGDRWQHGEPRLAVVDEYPGAHLHLYGKHEARPGRKMGHLTVLATQSGSDVVAMMHELRESMTLSGGSDEHQ